jgi:ComF family protein
LEDLIEAMISFSDLEILAKRKFSLVTCVPLHKSRLKERGYNQAALIGERIAKYMQIPFDEKLLKRIKKTKVQSGLVRSERVKNIKGAFELVGEIRGKRVLLVDDVWTTGSTMRECSRVIKINGANEVWGLVLAM